MDLWSILVVRAAKLLVVRDIIKSHSRPFYFKYISHVYVKNEGILVVLAGSGHRAAHAGH